jgi:2',5'-phosphodiesterase
MLQVVPLPSIEELQQHVALPSVVFPSDHVALVADVLWKQV